MSPWFLRGNDFTHGTGAGVFAIGRDYGSMSTWVSFRIITKIK